MKARNHRVMSMAAAAMAMILPGSAFAQEAQEAVADNAAAVEAAAPASHFAFPGASVSPDNVNGLAIQGHAHDWQLYFQEPASEIMQHLYNLSGGLHIIAAIISVFVLILLGIVVVRFNEKRNPTPSKTSHNTVIEILWTTIPILILVAIAIPSLRLHYKMAYVEQPEMTLKVTGYQWYWNYTYPDHGNFSFDSYMIKDADIKPENGEIRLLSTDNKVVIPVDTTVRVLMTAADVIHAWALPAMGVKKDAVPGRLNETWFRATKEGVYYGQCSELCGVNHGFMPIEVHVVSKEAFAAWVEQAKAKYAQVEPKGTHSVALLDRIFQ
jgi:cytochrome c oxidase subunit 2